MTNEIINAKVNEIEMLEAQIKELKSFVDGLKDDLKAELDAKKVDVIDTGINKIWYQAICKKVVDTKALKDAGLYDEYSKDQLSTQFKITKTK